MHNKLFVTTPRTVVHLLLIVALLSVLIKVLLKNNVSNLLKFYTINNMKYLSFDSRFSSASLRIAVIGSSGYIGSRLLDHLRNEENWTVTGYDRIDGKRRKGKYRKVKMSKKKLENIEKENVDT